MTESSLGTEIKNAEQESTEALGRGLTAMGLASLFSGVLSASFVYIPEEGESVIENEDQSGITSIDP